MDDATVLRTLALGFMPDTSEAWERVQAPGHWTPFIDGLRRIVGDSRPLGSEIIPYNNRPKTPLQEVLAEAELQALFAPPGPCAMKEFAQRHFVGGLPCSAVPVESLYVPWAPQGSPSLIHGKGHYQSTSSLIMRDLLAGLGLEPPAALASYPDHLSIQLEVLAYLAEQRLCREADDFLQKRFGWLSEYRGRLVALGKEGRFHLALVDAVLAIRAQRAREC